MKQSYLKSASKYVFIYLFLQLFITTLSAQTGTSQQGAYFRSKQSGNWNNISTWEASFDNINWVNATVSPTFSANTITVQAGHDVSITASETIDQLVVYGKLTYADVTGSTLTINNGEGIDLEIYGTFEDLGTNNIIWNSGATWIIQETQSTLIQIKGYTLDWLLHHYNQNFPFGNWILRKTGNDGPLLSPGNYPNIIIENNSTSTWITDPISTFIANEGVYAASLNIGGNGTGDVSFLINENCYSSFFLDYDLTVKEGSTIRNYGTGIELKGNLFINGEIDYGSSNAGITLISANEFDRSISSSTSVTLKNLSLKNLELDVNPKVPIVTLNCPLTITGTFTFTTGYLITDNTNILTFGENAIAAGASDASFVSGPVQKIGNTAFTFPVGKEGNYQPIGISAPSDINSVFKAEYFKGDHGLGDEREATIQNISNCEYWNLENIGGANSLEVSLFQDQIDCNQNNLPNSDSRIAYWDGSFWLNLGNSLTSGVFVESESSFNKFGIFTIAEKSEPEVCGDEIVRQIQEAHTPDFNERLQAQEELLRMKMNENAANPGRRLSQCLNDPRLIIPVVVHIVHNGESIGTGTNISDEQVFSQIQALNDNFNLTSGTITEIEFHLAHNSGSGIPFNSGTPGIMRYNDPDASSHFFNDNSNEAPELLDLTNADVNFPFGNYLNIWVVTEIPGLPGRTQGYAPLPISGTYPIDGIVVRSDVFGSNEYNETFNLQPNSIPPFSSIRDQGKVMVHEVGHYLNLYHTFQGGCALANDNCEFQGDFVCDTEPVKQEKISSLCNFISDPANPPCNTPVPFNNFMYYAQDPCQNLFTSEQTLRMRTFLENFRSDLTTLENLSFTGVARPGGSSAGDLDPILAAEIETITNIHCAGNPVSLNTNIGAGYSANSWIWDFGDLSGTNSTTSASVTHTYSEPGSYTITLTAIDAIGIQSTCLKEIVVGNCLLDCPSQANWRFGSNSIAIDFKSGIPILSAQVHNLIKEAAITQNDGFGNLLFYSDGVSIWDNMGNPLTTGLIGDPSSAQMCVCPVPGMNDSYYIIYKNANGQLFYTKIIVNGSGGIYNYSIAEVNTEINKPNDLSEQFIITPHSNGIDYWLIGRSMYFSQNQYMEFLITCNGISYITNYPSLSSYINWTPGELAVSPPFWISGQMMSVLAMSGHDNSPGIVKADFNNTTGVISKPIILSTGSGYGLEFNSEFGSPNKFLYVSENGPNFSQKGIFQYNLQTGTRKLLSGPSFGAYFGLEQGPDGNIYVATQGNYIGAIVNSNSNPSFLPQFLLNPQSGNWGLPNMNSCAAIPLKELDFEINSLNCASREFLIPLDWQFYEISWDFGDGIVTPFGQFNSSTTHVYTNSGTYSVILKIKNGTCEMEISKQHLINIDPPEISGLNNICLGMESEYSTSLYPGVNYNWSVTGGTIIGGNTSNVIFITWQIPGGTLTLNVNNQGCTSSNSIPVNVYTGPTVFAGDSKSICEGGSVMLGGSPTIIGGTAPYQIQWTPGTFLNSVSSENPLAENMTETTTFYLSVIDANGCEGVGSTIINVIPVDEIIIGGPINACSGIEASYYVPLNSNYTYSWSIVSGTGSFKDGLQVGPNIIVTWFAPGVLQVTSTNNITGCSSISTINVNVSTPDATITAGSGALNIGCFQKELRVPFNATYSYQWQKDGVVDLTEITNTYLVTETGTYTVTITSPEGCTSINSQAVEILISDKTLTMEINCGSITLIAPQNASNTFQYQWFKNPPGGAMTGETSSTLIATETGSNYRAVIIAHANCSTTTNTIPLPAYPTTIPSSDFTFPEFDKIEENVILFEAVDNTVGKYAWDLHDGYLSVFEEIPTKEITFPFPGYYIVSLTTENICGSSTTDKLIHIIPFAEQYITTVECLNNFNYTYINHEISGNVPWSGGNPIYIKGTLTIKKGATLTISAGQQVLFGPEGKIIIERGDSENNGGKLILQNSTLKGIEYPCNLAVMWLGIEVHGYSDVNATTSVQGKIFIKNNAIIQDAYNGIVLGKPIFILNTNQSDKLSGSYFSTDLHDEGYGGGIIQAANSTFRNCGVGIKVRSNSIFSNSKFIENCTFISVSGLIDPYFYEFGSNDYFEFNISGHNPHIRHVISNAKPNIGLIGIDFYNSKRIPVKDNTFQNLKVGIYGFDSKLQITNGTGPGNFFFDLDYGIYAWYDKVTTSANSINNNRFQNYQSGISLESGFADQIKGNEFNIELGTSQGQNLKGITLSFSTGFAVLDNRFNLNKTGIQVNSSGSTQARISTANGSGNFFTKCLRGIETNNFNGKLSIRCNQFFNPAAETYSTNWEVKGKLFTQGRSGSGVKDPAGNRFDQGGSNPKRHIANEPCTPPCLSYNFDYYHHSNDFTTPSKFSTSSNYTGKDALVQFPSDPLLACGNLSLRSLTDLVPIHNLKQEIQILENELRWMNENLDHGKTNELLEAINSNMPVNQLKNKLLENSPLSDTVIHGLLNRQVPVPPQALREIIIPNSPVSGKINPSLEKKIKNLPPTVQENIRKAQITNEPYRTITGIEREISYKEYDRQEMVFESLNYFSENELQDDAISLLEEEPLAEFKRAHIGLLIEKKDYQQANERLIAYPSLASEDIAFRDLYNIYVSLGMQDKDYRAMETLQIERVDEIARMCPENYASVNARALMERIFNLRIPKCDDAMLGSREVNTDDDQKKELHAPIQGVRREEILNTPFLGDNIPNPFNSITRVPYFLPKGFSGRLSIYNMQGQEITRIELLPGLHHAEVDLKNSGPGLYVYTMSSNDGKTMLHKKMMLQK